MREPMTQNRGKERLTVQWLSQSIDELRKEVAEVQQISSESSLRSVRRSDAAEELREMKGDLLKLKLEIESLRSRQETAEEQMLTIQTEAQQSVADLRLSMLEFHHHSSSNSNSDGEKKQVRKPKSDAEKQLAMLLFLLMIVKRMPLAVFGPSNLNATAREEGKRKAQQMNEPRH